MSLRVSSSGSYEAFTQDTQRLQRLTYGAQAEIQTGQRMGLPSDDPDGMGVVLKNQSDKRMITAWEKNRLNASFINDSCHRHLSDYYDNVHVAAQTISANVAAKSPGDLALLGVQVNGLVERGFGILESKYALGEYLFGGNNINTPPFAATRDAAGNITHVQYVGATSSRSFTISEDQQVSPQLDTQSAANLADYMNHLISLRDALNSGDEANVQIANQSLQSDESRILTSISGLGITATVIDSFEDVNQLLYRNYDQMISQRVDSDLADAATRLMRHQTALEAALRSANIVMKTNIFQYA